MYDVTHRESYKVASDWIKATNMVSIYSQSDNAGFYRAISIQNSGLIIIIAVSGHCPIGRGFNFSFFFNTEISPVECRRCRDGVGRKQD